MEEIQNHQSDMLEPELISSIKELKVIIINIQIIKITYNNNKKKNIKQY